MPLPHALRSAISGLLEGQKLGRVSIEQARISNTYRAGGRSFGAVASDDAIAAYLLGRLPATFASVERALDELAGALPDFAPRTILDVGCGPGTAGFAALAAFPDAKSLRGLDHNKRFLQVATQIAAGAGLSQVTEIAYQKAELTGEFPLEPADLVVMAYALVELDARAVERLAQRLWGMTGGALVLVEPGSTAGFARIRRVREILVAAGAQILAPCTHAHACPMPDGDWCHFTVRLARSREHQRVKQAYVPYEDEKFSYLIAARSGEPRFAARIVAPVQHHKGRHQIPACDRSGLHMREITTRDASFKAAKKWRWGDGIG